LVGFAGSYNDCQKRDRCRDSEAHAANIGYLEKKITDAFMGTVNAELWILKGEEFTSLIPSLFTNQASEFTLQNTVLYLFPVSLIATFQSSGAQHDYQL
jgi:hypothetical protein